MDLFKTINKWSEWYGLSVDIKILTPGVCLHLPGAIYMWKNMKKRVAGLQKTDFLPVQTDF